MRMRWVRAVALGDFACVFAKDFVLRSHYHLVCCRSGIERFKRCETPKRCMQKISLESAAHEATFSRGVMTISPILSFMIHSYGDTRLRLFLCSRFERSQGALCPLSKSHLKLS